MKSSKSLVSTFFWSLLGALTLSACSSTPAQPPAPSWVDQPARTVDQGYIVYVASSQDRSADQARFKAESQAYQDLANECSFPPKGARTEDRYVRQVGVEQQVYVKVAVDFQTCDEAKQAIQPEDIRKLANVAMTDQIKTYQEKYEAPPEDDEEQANASGTEDVSDETRAVLDSKQAPPPTYVSSPVQFYVARQQVFYYKQDVILSPPNAYPPNSPQTAQFVSQVQAPVSRVNQYEAANPGLRTSSQTWSTTHQQAVRSYQIARPASHYGQNRASGMSNQNRQNRPNQGRNGLGRNNPGRPPNHGNPNRPNPNNKGNSKQKPRRRRRNS